MNVHTGVGTRSNRLSKEFWDRYDRKLKGCNFDENQRMRINALEEHVNRMPLEYVLKADFVREMRDMNDHFRAIHNKLDKLVEKLIEK